MSEPVVLRTPLARLDLFPCYVSIGERSPRAARRFRLAAERTFSSLAQSPGLGASYDVENPRLAGLRCARVGRLKNYLIFYLTIPGGIEVVRVLHGARDIPAILEGEAGD